MECIKKCPTADQIGGVRKHPTEGLKGLDGAGTASRLMSRERLCAKFCRFSVTLGVSFHCVLEQLEIFGTSGIHEVPDIRV